jgi:hypothetical protein
MTPPNEQVSKHSFSFPKRDKSAMTVSFEDDEPEPSTESTPSAPSTPAPVSVRPPAVPKAPVDKNPDLLSVELPSKWMFYPFKSLSLASVRGKHQAKFAAAAKHESTRMVVETVSSLIGENIDASQLTVPDFQFVLYQLRLNCMGSTIPMKVRGLCSDPDHVLKVAEGQLSRESLINDDLVNSSQIKDTYIDDEAIPNFQLDHGDAIEELNALGYDLDAPRYADSIELEEQYFGKPGFDEVEFLSDLAGSIRAIDGSPKTLAERLEIVGDFPPRITKLLQDWQSVVQSYGVQEFINITCKECGSEIEVSASVPVHSFF